MELIMEIDTNGVKRPLKKARGPSFFKMEDVMAKEVLTPCNLCSLMETCSRVLTKSKGYPITVPVTPEAKPAMKLSETPCLTVFCRCVVMASN